MARTGGGGGRSIGTVGALADEMERREAVAAPAMAERTCSAPAATRASRNTAHGCGVQCLREGCAQWRRWGGATCTLSIKHWLCAGVDWQRLGCDWRVWQPRVNLYSRGMGVVHLVSIADAQQLRVMEEGAISDRRLGAHESHAREISLANCKYAFESNDKNAPRVFEHFTIDSHCAFLELAARLRIA